MGGAIAMGTALVMCQCKVFCESVLRSIMLAGRLLLGSRKDGDGDGEAGYGTWKEGSDHAIYEGVVYHERRHPVLNRFEYKVRYALVNLDKVPSWFTRASHHHMTAQQARSMVGTSGPVYLLCMPTSVGYEQNPLSVYYCYDSPGPKGLSLPKTIAEVTNTPWGERATFTFDSNHDTVPKALHVSPFMDMLGAWRMHAPPPGEKLLLTIGVEHPQFGSFFVATLRAKKIDQVQSPESFLWLMPQKAAVLIYWQALVLMWKGVGFVQHPKYVDGDLYKRRAQERDAEMHRERTSWNKAEAKVASDGEAELSKRAKCPRLCEWQEAEGYPWL